MAEKYLKIVKIGTGTFGEAWLVNSLCSQRNYVMKEVRVAHMNEQDLDKTQREAAVLARCKHLNIIRYKESFLRPDPLTMCLVMEYADGGDLSEHIQYAKQATMIIPEATILHWFIQVIFAVQYLHSNDILHRDLKTQNIFLTRSNLVKVGDFGIARFLRGKQDLATTAIGTPYYLSPEICQRKPYNYKSDMWAVGCILYELCTLRHPFEAEDFSKLLLVILNGTYFPIPEHYSELVHKLVSLLLRNEPEKRPSADQILVAPALKLLVQQYIEKHEKLLQSFYSPSSVQVRNEVIDRRELEVVSKDVENPTYENMEAILQEKLRKKSFSESNPLASPKEKLPPLCHRSPPPPPPAPPPSPQPCKRSSIKSEIGATQRKCLEVIASLCSPNRAVKKRDAHTQTPPDWRCKSEESGKTDVTCEDARFLRKCETKKARIDSFEEEFSDSGISKNTFIDMSSGSCFTKLSDLEDMEDCNEFIVNI